HPPGSFSPLLRPARSRDSSSTILARANSYSADAGTSSTPDKEKFRSSPPCVHIYDDHHINKREQGAKIMNRAVIAGFARTPFHFANKGKLVGVRPDDLAAAAIRGLVEKTGVDPASLEDVILGCAYPEAEQGGNIARLALLLAGLPIELGGITMNRFCGSSMSAIHYA